MPTIMSHAVAAGGLASVLTTGRRLPPMFWGLCAGLAMLPDVDVVAYAFRLPSDSMWAHRGITHSVPAAAVTAALVALLTRRRLPLSSARLWLSLVVSMASHGLLDMLTDGGSAVAVWAPLSSSRYFWPWRPLLVSPIGVAFFSEWGMRTLRNEIGWLWLPSLLLVLLVRAGRATVR